jgi:hypothetical protein
VHAITHREINLTRVQCIRKKSIEIFAELRQCGRFMGEFLVGWENVKV